MVVVVVVVVVCAGDHRRPSIPQWGISAVAVASCRLSAPIGQSSRPMRVAERESGQARVAGWALRRCSRRPTGRVVVRCGLRAGDLVREVVDTGEAFAGPGRVTGLVGAYLVLVDGAAAGPDPGPRPPSASPARRWHRATARRAALLIAHTRA